MIKTDVNGCTRVEDRIGQDIALTVVHRRCDDAARMHVLGCDDQALNVVMIHESEVNVMNWIMAATDISAELFVRTGETLTFLVRDDYDHIKASGIFQVHLGGDAILVPCTASRLHLRFIAK